jgi:hypothetical protein
MIHTYKYHIFFSIYKNILWSTLPFMLIAFPVYIIRGDMTFGLFLVFSYSYILYFYLPHMWADIKTSPEGLFVQFFFWFIKIDWEDVISLRKVKNSGRISLRTSIFVIQVRHLPFVYRIVGLFNIFRWTPCIPFMYYIPKRDQLIYDINMYTNERVSLDSK